MRKMKMTLLAACAIASVSASEGAPPAWAKERSCAELTDQMFDLGDAVHEARIREERGSRDWDVGNFTLEQKRRFINNAGKDIYLAFWADAAASEAQHNGCLNTNDFQGAAEGYKKEAKELMDKAVKWHDDYLARLYAEGGSTY
jgi:hypothetical protein